MLSSKWFQCVLDDDETFENGEHKPYHERSEGSLYPLFIDQSTSPSSSTPWLKFPDVSQIDNFNLLNMKVCSLVNIWHNMLNYCSINFLLFNKSQRSFAFGKFQNYRESFFKRRRQISFHLNQVISNFKISLANKAERLIGRPNKLSSVLIISLICYM